MALHLGPQMRRDIGEVPGRRVTRITGDDDAVGRRVIGDRSEGMHAPGMGTVRPRHGQTVGVDPVAGKVVVRVKPLPLQGRQIEDQRAVRPIASMLLAAEQHQPAAPTVEGAAAVAPPHEGDRVARTLLVNLDPQSRG
jgi:hypothetical protein